MKLKGECYEVGFESQIFKIPKNFLKFYEKGVIGLERMRIKELIEFEMKQLIKVDDNIPDKFKELVDNETNQHMRLTASLSQLQWLKEQLNKSKEKKNE